METTTTTYFTLIKTLLRPDNADAAQKKAARRACTWLNDNIGQVRRYTEGEQCTLIGLIWDHYLTHKEGPNSAIIECQVNQSADPALMTLFSDFKESDMPDHSGWIHHEPEYLPALWATVVKERKETLSLRLWQNAALIVKQGLDLAEHGVKVRYKGPEAALRYVLARLDRDTLQLCTGRNRVDLSDDIREIDLRRDRCHDARRLSADPQRVPSID